MCGRDVNIEISETYQTGIFFSALYIFVYLTPNSLIHNVNCGDGRGRTAVQTL